MNGDKPTVYGTPEQFAELLASLHKIAEAEPDETFADEGVRGAAHHLVTLLLSRQASVHGVVRFAPDGSPSKR